MLMVSVLLSVHESIYHFFGALNRRLRVRNDDVLPVSGELVDPEIIPKGRGLDLVTAVVRRVGAVRVLQIGRLHGLSPLGSLSVRSYLLSALSC